MSPSQRASFLDEVHASLEQADFMSEGRPHAHAKNKAMDKLGRHFQRIGRRIYLASELPVLYPGEPTVKPDLMAVLDVDDPGEQDERTAWVVADEGKGLDLALEVHYSGDEKKDFVANVIDYARMGIPEYFIYDRRRQALHGYHLASPGARRYQKMRPRFGRLRSNVLGLDLLIYDGRLRFYFGDAELPDSDELIQRIESLVDDIQRRRDEAEAQAAQAEAHAAQAEAQAAQADERAARFLADLRATVLDILTARGLSPDEAVTARVQACSDTTQLRRWATRAVTARAAADLLTDA